jgi:diketogulonate reductase-like aldo/keto reductase
MEDLLSEGMVRSIGVSNYGLHHLEHLKRYARVLPSVNQVELNPWIQRRELHQATRDIGALTMAYSPLARGQKAQDRQLESMCEGLGFTAPQAAIKWCIDNGAVVIPKSSHPGRQLENFQSMDVDLSRIIDEMNKLDSNHVSGWDPTVEP